MADIQIRAFQPADTDAVLALILSIQRDEFGIAITAADQPDLRAIPDFYQSGSGGFWVAVQDGAVVGTIGLRDIGEGRAALRKMFVAPPARGREQGAAAALLATLVAHARGAGLAEILLGTTETFLAAHRFYEKNGFLAVPQAALPAGFPVMAVDRRFYRLTLDPPGQAGEA